MVAIAIVSLIVLAVPHKRFDLAVLAIVVFACEAGMHHYLDHNSLAGVTVPLHGCASASHALYNAISHI